MVDQLISDILCNVKNKMKDYFFLKEETYNKNDIDTKTTTLQNNINNKSKVVFSRSLNSGTKIGKITIDGVGTDIYCEKDTNTTYTPASATPLADATTGKVGVSTKYAREDHIHPTDKTKVAFSRTLNSGTKIGTITIDGTSTDLYCEKDTNTTYTPASVIPLADATTGKVGTSNKYAREDHIHPTDKTKVSFSRSLNSGTKIGTITINGTNTDLYCEKNTDTVYTHPSTHSTNIIVDPNTYANIGITTSNSTQSTINSKINTAIGQKVTSVTGKGLSTNDYTTNEKNKLAGLKNYSIATVANDGLMSSEYMKALSDLVDAYGSAKTKTLHSKIKLFKYGQVVTITFDSWTFNQAKDNAYHNIDPSGTVKVPVGYRPVQTVYLRDVVDNIHLVIGADGVISGMANPNSSGYVHTQGTWITNDTTE